MSIALFIDIRQYHIFYIVAETTDLRKILSQNIKAARKALHLTQTKLAESADISLPYMTDIEHCKTWVSDKTLINIARALNMEVYQLFMPMEDNSERKDSDQNKILREIADIVDVKKKNLRKIAENIMDELLDQIIRLYSER
jgi:transcriptional regulator with XRE-family HTH domain